MSNDFRTTEAGQSMLKLQRCDGVKPICGPCRTNPQDDPCEYSDGPTRSRTKVLEDTVSRLEARLHELEHPNDYTPSITLFDPYRQFNSSPYHTQNKLSLSPPPLDPADFTSLPSSPQSSPDSMHNYVPLNVYGPHQSPLGLFDSHSLRRSHDLDYGPPIDFILIPKFLDHAPEFGFFLDKERLMHSMRLPDRSKPSAALLYAMQLWGAHLSSDIRREDYFKRKALQSAATELHISSLFLHTLQAKVLLGYFFFRTGALLAARAHTAAAFALAIGVGLHRIRSSPDSQTHTWVDPGTGKGVSLPPPRDAVEEGERINAFWAVFVLQKNLGMALDAAVFVRPFFTSGGNELSEKA
ncbi:hypothetical protein FB45DRAFT_860984 [Roridomyces roridus]|uniref:Xylanolytic transcriptional activator regulatory domain-containing protein n=1 Tax=Roridomyces roridus TaxID=1738132 RepID=A0AAD7CGQ1_9AGAR|nr:hypothetical protein FB45DRAFT_860984 [Roridomyces roridus]